MRDACGSQSGSTLGAARLSAAGPDPSFDEIYRSQRTALLRLAYLLVHSPAEAEELTQDTFARLLQHFDEVDNPAGFLRTALVRLSLNWQSRNRMERDRLALAPIPPDPCQPEPDEMWAALARLRPERRAVLVLRYYLDLPIKEIASVIGCPDSTARTRLHRGLADLRKELDP